MLKITFTSLDVGKRVLGDFVCSLTSPVGQIHTDVGRVDFKAELSVVECLGLSLVNVISHTKPWKWLVKRV